MMTDIEDLQKSIAKLNGERDNAISKVTSLELELEHLGSQYTKLQLSHEAISSKEASIHEELKSLREKNENLNNEIKLKNAILEGSISHVEYQNVVSQNSVLNTHVDSLTKSFEEEKTRFSHILETRELDLRELRLSEHTLREKIVALEQQVEEFLSREFLQERERAELVEAFRAKESSWASERAFYSIEKEKCERVNRVKLNEFQEYIELLNNTLSQLRHENSILRSDLKYSNSQIDEHKKLLEDNVSC
jgi:chromosome segregation ATPase